jgi:predicted RNase H-like HicB family nuclease
MVEYMKFTITITTDEDGMYIAECPSIPGFVSQGAIEHEAERNIQDAIKECLEVRAKKGMPCAKMSGSLGNAAARLQLI